jgi:hypothetical protein
MAMTGRDLVEAARKAVPKMSNAQLQEHLTSGTPIARTRPGGVVGPEP